MSVAGEVGLTRHDGRLVESKPSFYIPYLEEKKVSQKIWPSMGWSHLEGAVLGGGNECVWVVRVECDMCDG